MFIIICDQQGKILQASREFLETVGRPVTDVIGNDCVAFFRRAANDEWRAADFFAEIEKGESDPIILLGPAARESEVALDAVDLTCGKEVRKAIIGEPVTVRALGLEALPGWKVLNNVEGAMLAENQEGVITFANTKMLEMVDFTETELVGKHWSAIVPHEERRWVEQQLRVRLRGEHNQYETAILTRSRTRIPVIVSARPITHDGRYIGTISTFTDITERKQTEYELRANAERMEQLNTTLNRQRARLLELTDELAHANEELQRLSEAKSEFVNQVSHDLRNPLHALIESVSLVQDGSLGEINEEQAKWLKLAVDDGWRLNELIRDILDQAKLETGKLTANKVRVTAEEQIVQVRRTYDSLVREKGLTLVSEVAPGTPPLFCDKGHYGRVLENLVSNAIKYTDTGGTITIAVRPHAPGGVVSSVQDTGMGIPKDQQHVIFGRFDMIKRVEGQQRAGSGLGLNLCRQLVELNGGTIGFESEEHKGSRFFFVLPAYDEMTDLAYMLGTVAQYAKSVSCLTAAYLFAPTCVERAQSLLESVVEVIRPRTVVHDMLRTFPERKVVILVSAHTREDAKSAFAESLDALNEARIKDVAAAFHVCPEELLAPEALLSALERKLKPIGTPAEQPPVTPRPQL